MNYLAKNLNNSSVLSYDIMKIIYEYSDPLIDIRKQIENKDYDLDEIMYQRMKKYIIKNSSHIETLNYMMTTEKDLILIHKHNIHNRNFIKYFLNAKCGYKDFFLWKTTRPTPVCGIIINNSQHKTYIKYKMKQDLTYVNNETNYNKYSKKQLYKKWLKL